MVVVVSVAVVVVVVVAAAAAGDGGAWRPLVAFSWFYFLWSGGGRHGGAITGRSEEELY